MSEAEERRVLRDLYESTAADADDLTLLTTIDDANIASHLSARLSNEEKMYTAIGDILVAVNPFKHLQKGGMSIVDEKVVRHYLRSEPMGLAPHIFKTAADAFTHMRDQREDVCIIVTGESGAGKTESAKLILNFVAIVSPDDDKKKRVNVQEVKRYLLSSSPVLEALGNAKTSRNDNSSRFGKFVQLRFDLSGAVVGGRISNYLLEKSRVVRSGRHERSFHIFYQLLAIGKAKAQQSENDPTSFAYLRNQSGDDDEGVASSFIVDGVDDLAEGKAVLAAMDDVGISETDQGAIDSILRGILCLGNLKFTASDDGYTTSVTSDTRAWLVEASDRLGVESHELLEMALVKHTLTSAASRSSVSCRILTGSEAKANADTLAKELYKRLFQWIVEAINARMDMLENGRGKEAGKASAAALGLGVLDIYGFEILEENGFEQLCINYVNEKLHQYAIALTLKAEQDEYANEGIGWVNVAFEDNLPVVTLIEKPGGGLFNVLDEACTFKGATDDRFASALTSAFIKKSGSTGNKSNSIVSAPRLRESEAFVVAHYAGAVEYTYAFNGFVRKNIDSLFNDLVDAMGASTSPHVAQLFAADQARSDTERRKRPVSVGLQFKRQVLALVATLEACRPSYVRCVKPNATKKAISADPQLMLHQVQYLGLTESVKVRRAGFVLRMPFLRFLRRYGLCSGHTDVWPLNQSLCQSGDEAAGQLCRQLLSSSTQSTFLASNKAVSHKSKPLNFVDGTDFVVGKTKIFIKTALTVFCLEEMRSAILPYVATSINKTARCYLQRKTFLRAVANITTAIAHVRRFNAMTSYARDRARILRITCRIRVFLEKRRIAKLRTQFRNRPPRVYALEIQRRVRGNAARSALPPDVRETAAKKMYNVRYAKSVRELQCFTRRVTARWQLKQHRAARRVANAWRVTSSRAALKANREEEFDSVAGMLRHEGVRFQKHASATALRKNHNHVQPAPHTKQQPAEGVVPEPSADDSRAVEAAKTGEALKWKCLRCEQVAKKKEKKGGAKQDSNSKSGDSPRTPTLTEMDSEQELFWPSSSFFRKTSRVRVKELVKVLRAERLTDNTTVTDHQFFTPDGIPQHVLARTLLVITGQTGSGSNGSAEKAKRQAARIRCIIFEMESEWHRDRLLRTLEHIAIEAHQNNPAATE